MISYKTSGGKLHVFLSGSCDNTIPKGEIDKLLQISSARHITHCSVYFDDVVKYDISFLVLLYDVISSLKSRHVALDFVANNDNSKKILEILDDIHRAKNENPYIQPLNPAWRLLSYIGEFVCDYARVARDFIAFIGAVIVSLCVALARPSAIRLNAINYHIYHGVITAMPIIFIVSFVVGGVIAYQGGVTLERMGFSQATVEMTAKLTLREIGPFVVALIAAGRSASSYTAQIGVMKMTEELFAMKTMNFNAYHFIVVPRFIALVISFPFMVFLSDLISIFGCMVFLRYGFDITYMDYIAQLKEFVNMNSFWVGIIKAPFYAMTIVVIGCFIGFRVEDNTQSVGEKTTTSVVYALLGVILVNALFSLIFTELKF